MDATSLLIFLAIGALAGWIAGNLLKGGGFGLLGNILVGVIGAVVGAVVGGWAFGLLGIAANGLVGSLVTAVAGAVILLFIAGLIRR
ncbi:MAG: GlsB/YeaQ/YmgE family stress response membrane protein [Candidatus Sedimenticola sp. 20ELBAFRAG]